MIGFMPDIYPDELIYSWFARYYLKSGYCYYKEVFKDLYINHFEKPSIEFINPLNKEAEKVINNIIPVNELVIKHTLFNYYTRFISLDRKKTAFDVMITSGKIDRKSLGLPINRSGVKRFLRYCPLCVEDDREKYGEAYWHCLHQLRELEICHIHFCRLQDSNIPISARASPRLFPLDAEAIKSDIEIDTDETTKKLALYIREILFAPVNMSNDVSIAEFLDSKLDNTPYVSVRGQQRNMKMFHLDYSNYYKRKGIMSLWQIEKLFSGCRLRTIEICQVAMFLQIKPGELLDMKLPSQKRDDKFDMVFRKLKSEGYTYSEIARKMNASFDSIKNAARKKRTNKLVSVVIKNKPGPKKMDYDELDLKLLPKVRCVALELYYGQGSRPQRVTVFGVERKLKLPSKVLLRLPKCLAEIKIYYEDYEEFWARELIWAISNLEKANSRINYTGVRKLTNLNRRNFILGLKKLKETKSLRKRSTVLEYAYLIFPKHLGAKVVFRIRQGLFHWGSINNIAL